MKPVTHALGPEDVPTLADVQAAVRRLEAADIRRNPFEVQQWALPDLSRLGPEWTSLPEPPK